LAKEARFSFDFVNIRSNILKLLKVPRKGSGSTTRLLSYEYIAGNSLNET